MPPSTGMHAPDMPDPLPRAVTGTRAAAHAWRTAATSPEVVGVDGDGHHRRGRQRLVVPVVLLDLGPERTLSAPTTAASCSMISPTLRALTRSREGCPQRRRWRLR